MKTYKYKLQQTLKNVSFRTYVQKATQNHHSSQNFNITKIE
jgi:hypothetical protein